MYELDQKYIDQLEDLAQAIQEADELAKYLEEEEEADYMQLKELYEPLIGEIYEQVASETPLQLILLEQVLLDPAFEGLFLPKILGYSVLRGEIDAKYAYTRPQEHFKEILLAICQSSNFEILKKRIGQSIQIGFALSSDIWVTNLINSQSNKRIRHFLQSQKLEKYRVDAERISGYQRYQRQFVNDNFYTADFPTTPTELTLFFGQLKHFLLYRIKTKQDNSSLLEPMKAFVANAELQGRPEHLQIMALYAAFFDLEEADSKHLAEHLNKTRSTMPEFDAEFLALISELHRSSEVDLDQRADQRVSALLDKTVKGDLADYYTLTDIIHSKGYINEEAQVAVREVYSVHKGVSTINECIRQTIYHYFARLINNIEEDAYPDFIEASRIFPIYMHIFANERFNQDLENLSMNYINKLLVRFADKRGKDYQDIKKFVSSVFLDLGFLKEKEVVELFKTRRKKTKEE